MSVRLPGFVDHHAHLLRTCAGTAAPWTSADEVRAFHEQCRDRGVSPVDDLEEPATPGLGDRLIEGLERAASVGIVEVWEAGARSWAYLDALSRLRERGPLPVRVRLLAAAGLAELGMRPRTGDASLDVVGVKFYADGWLGPRTCATGHGFVDDPHRDGILFQSADVLARRIEPFAHREWTIATHAIGDLAIQTVLEAYDRVYGSDCAAAAPRIEHAQLLRPDLIERMAEQGVVACIQPAFALDDAAAVEAGLGDEWPDAYRWSKLLDAGVRVICGSDFPIAELEPLAGLSKLLQNPFDDLPTATALSLMTDASAGHVVLSADPRDVSVGELKDLEVLEVNVLD